MLGSSSFQKCAYDPQNASQYEQYSGSSFFSLINHILDWTRITCAGLFVHDTHDEILAAFTVLLAIFTLALWASTSRIAEEAKESSGKTIKTMEAAATQQATDTQTSLGIAQRSADAATETVATMERNARKELRAYMGVATNHIVRDRGSRSSDSWELVIQNFGKTMAQDTRIRISTILAGEGETEFPWGDITTKTVVMPGESLGFHIDITMPRPASTSSRAFLWGKIEYDDVFGEDHWTTFRFMSDQEAYVIGNTPGWATKHCDDGNKAT